MIRFLIVAVITVIAFAVWNKKQLADSAAAAISAPQLLKTHALTEVDGGYSEAALHD